MFLATMVYVPTLSSPRCDIQIYFRKKLDPNEESQNYNSWSKVDEIYVFYSGSISTNSIIFNMTCEPEIFGMKFRFPAMSGNSLNTNYRL